MYDESYLSVADEGRQPCIIVTVSDDAGTRWRPNAGWGQERTFVAVQRGDGTMAGTAGRARQPFKAVSNAPAKPWNSC
jgi:hypothetical protein